MNPEKIADPGRIRGFTLIELLVVIAVIAILAALLLSALASAKSNAWRMKCVSNQHQIGIGLLMYTDDFHETFPTYSGWGSWGGKPGSGQPSFGNLAGYGFDVPIAQRVVDPYVKNPEVFHCPGDKGDTYDFPQWTSTQSCFDCWGNSYLLLWRQMGWTSADYGANGQYGWGYYGMETLGGDSDLAGNIYTPPMKRSEMKTFIANKILMLEWAGAPDRTPDPTDTWHGFKGKPIFNILYADGHVQLRYYSASYSSPALTRDQPVDPMARNFW